MGFGGGDFGGCCVYPQTRVWRWWDFRAHRAVSCGRVGAVRLLARRNQSGFLLSGRGYARTPLAFSYAHAPTMLLEQGRL